MDPYSIIQSSFTVLKILCALFIPPSPQPLTTTYLFTLSTVLLDKLSPECCIVGIIQYI